MGVRVLLPGAAGGVREPAAYFRRGLCVLLLLFRYVAGARTELYRADDGALWPRPEEPDSRARQQRWLSPPILHAERHTGPRNRAGGERRRRSRTQGRADADQVLRH